MKDNEALEALRAVRDRLHDLAQAIFSAEIALTAVVVAADPAQDEATRIELVRQDGATRGPRAQDEAMRTRPRGRPVGGRGPLEGLGEWIQRERLLRRMTQLELARAVGVGAQVISTYESGRHPVPPGRLRLLEEAFGRVPVLEDARPLPLRAGTGGPPLGNDNAADRRRRGGPSSSEPDPDDRAGLLDPHKGLEKWP